METSTITTELPQSLKTKARYLGSAALVRLEQAYQVAEQAHRGMKRKTGDPFITHPVAVSEILADMHLDVDALMAGLLHDTVEDTQVTFEDIETQFGSNVRKIVEGETKISKLTVRVYEDEQAENLRQMLLAMVGDVRVILVKLADRLHNMRTLAAMPPHKQQKISRETLEIFAPLAHRLGISHIKNELEDLCFFYLEPERFKTLQRQVRMRQVEREAYVHESIESLKDRLTQEGLKFDVSGRSKHLYSIYRKMQRDGKTLDQIFDLMAIRAMVEPGKTGEFSDDDEKAVCYRALGIVHSLWTPIPGRFKDYVAVPKPNGYQSLHTTVIGLKGQPIEVQIRTRRMHQIAEFGVAAHWAYKQGLEDTEEIKRRLDWMKQLLDVDDTVESAGAFVDTVKTDLLSERVLVFTPAGDVMNLPRGSTPIDFAYHVHSEIGHRCIGSRVNGEIVTLNYQLQTGDRVEVLTNRSAHYGPSIDWLNFTVTRGAKQKIRQYFRLQERAGQLEAGKRTLERALRRKHLGISQYLTKTKLEAVSKTLLRSDSIEDLYLAISSKRLPTKQIIEALAPELLSKTPSTPAAQSVKRGIGGIFIEGIDAPAKLAQCCSPVRGDDVMGYITRGRGVTVHRINCPNVKHLIKSQKERFISAAWDAPGDEVFSVDFEVMAVDRPGLLKDILDIIATMNKSASRVAADVYDAMSARIHFRVDVKDYKEIQFIKDNVSKVRDVTHVYRAKPGIKG
jgi:GTP diphosphokinase / guanosine-3',5'-bis(diphosphate) 3'-diphosphatase